MKRAEQLAWGAFAGLVVVFALLLSGGIAYNFTAFWVGTMLAGGQALVVFLAAYGLMLGRQARELEEAPGIASAADMGFRMSGEAKSSVRPDADTDSSKTLDTGFQRLLVGIAGGLLLTMGGIAAYLLYAAYEWSAKNPEMKFPIAGSFLDAQNGKAHFLDEMGLLIGLAMALLYGAVYWITRPRRDTGADGEAVSSNFTLGLTAMAAMAVGTTLAYFHVAWASEIAAGVMAFFMLLQGLELLVNAFRSYSAIEEMDQDVIDLQATPLGPMLSSIWLSGLRMLFAQSVGLGGGKERGVIARMMPRALAAIAVIAIVVSCFRVVPPGEVAVLEHLGAAPTTAVPGQPAMRMLSKEAILQPGLHICYPWPIDKLVMIPSMQLQTTSVGTELHAAKEWKGVDFEFWTVRAQTAKDNDPEDLFVTGDKAPAAAPVPAGGAPRQGAPVAAAPSAGQVLETYVQVQWRVSRPDLFYSVLSHSEFAETNSTTNETTLVPIYEAIIKQCTAFAVTRTFAIHSLQQIMVTDRRETEQHCKEILQKKLDSLGQALGLEGSGIQVDFLTIKDLHPPYWRPDRADPSETPIGGQPVFTENGIQIRETQASRMKRGPASAFENVISMSEFRDAIIALAEGERTARRLAAEGTAAAEINDAKAYGSDRVARAHGEADRLVKITENMDPKAQPYQLRLMEQRLFYSTMADLLGPVNKIVTDPDVKNVEIWQATDKGVVPMMPAGR